MRLRSTRLTAIAAAVQQLSTSYNPGLLFANNEQGAWYDPSDMSTMFQDPAGTTPVTGMEQPVGLLLDKSKGLVLGPELVTNGTFDSNVNGWTSNQGQTPVWSAGRLRLSTQGSTGTSVLQAINCVVGRTYALSCSYMTVSGDGLGPALRISTSGVDYGASGQIYRTPTESPTAFLNRTAVFTATQATIYVYLIASGGAATSTYDFDNISVREIPGNHATQTTTAMRPVLQARYNLLTNTGTLSTQTVTVMATTQRLRFEGTGTITLYGAATGTYSAGSHTFTTTAGSLTLTVSGTVTRADLRAANDGIGLPAYQRVGAATSGSGSMAGNADYDTAGFPPYLRFFGAETWLSTASIDFTATDKMTVFAGVRKLSDAAYGAIAELGTNPDNTDKSFSLGTSGVTGDQFTRRTYIFGIRGTGGLKVYSATLFASPVTNTLSCEYFVNQSGAENQIKPRVNGAIPTLTEGIFTSTPAAEFATAQIFIGRRGGTSNPANIRLYQLIIRGAQSTAQQISDTDTWVNTKTGAY